MLRRRRNRASARRTCDSLSADCWPDIGLPCDPGYRLFLKNPVNSSPHRSARTPPVTSTR
jgi:hypothetical protein